MVMDEAITHWINAPAGNHPLLDTMMATTTNIGVPVLILFVVAQWWSSKDRLHVRHACVAAAISMFFGLFINQIVLLFVHRARPYDAGISHLIIARSADWSFPSDHATATFAIAVAFFLNRLPLRAAFLLVGALLVCLSRVYVGTHYFTDVLGGAVTGSLAAVAVSILYREGTRADRFVVRIL